MKNTDILNGKNDNSNMNGNMIDNLLVEAGISVSNRTDLLLSLTTQ